MQLRMMLIGGMYQVYLVNGAGEPLTLLGSGYTDDAAKETAIRALTQLVTNVRALEVDRQ